MKREWITVLLLLVASGISYGVYYQSAVRESARAVEGDQSEIKWLKKEFELTDSQFLAVVDLHSRFQSRCDSMCGRIAEANNHLASLMSANQEVTDEVRAALERDAAVREECRLATLGHIYEVSRIMSPHQAERYLEMMTARLIRPGYDHTTRMSP